VLWKETAPSGYEIAPLGAQRADLAGHFERSETLSRANLAHMSFQAQGQRKGMIHTRTKQR